MASSVSGDVTGGNIIIPERDGLILCDTDGDQMPELPDVEVFRRYTDATSLHQQIDDVIVHTDEVLRDSTRDTLADALRGESFTSTGRHGKYLFIHLGDGTPVVVVHFGMSGWLKYFQDREDEPEYSRMLFSFHKGGHLSYCSKRKLGWVGLTDTVAGVIEDQGLGPDALSISREEFVDRFIDRRAMIKTALMDQEFLAGVGNIYSDEILFQAGIHPTIRASDVSRKRLGEVYDIMQEVLETAIEAGADPKDFPDSWIIPQRRKGGTCPACGTALERLTVGGRSAYVCPRDQPPP